MVGRQPLRRLEGLVRVAGRFLEAPDGAQIEVIEKV
jgi:hypothetical protein